MQNQFCKKCGQANFPNATSCSKCGQATNSQAAFGSDNAPRTVMPNKFLGASEKKSKAVFWIIGGLLAVTLIVVGLAMVIGAGVFLYTVNGDEAVRDYPAKEEKSPDLELKDERDNDPPPKTDSDNPLDDITFPSGKDVTFGDETSSTMNDKVLLNFFLQKKRVVGKFKLVDVKTTTDKTIFPNRSAGVQAEYKSGSKRLLHRVAIYTSIENARSDIATYKQNVKNSGAKMRGSRENQLSFVLKGVFYFAFYNPQGGLHEMSARNSKDISRYFAAYSRAGN